MLLQRGSRKTNDMSRRVSYWMWRAKRKKNLSNNGWLQAQWMQEKSSATMIKWRKKPHSRGQLKKPHSNALLKNFTVIADWKASQKQSQLANNSKKETNCQRELECLHWPCDYNLKLCLHWICRTNCPRWATWRAHFVVSQTQSARTFVPFHDVSSSASSAASHVDFDFSSNAALDWCLLSFQSSLRSIKRQQLLSALTSSSLCRCCWCFRWCLPPTGESFWKKNVFTLGCYFLN